LAATCNKGKASLLAICMVFLVIDRPGKDSLFLVCAGAPGIRD